jgi:glutathione S-transferase
MYTVFGGLRSRTFRVLWMLEELGLTYTHNPAAPRSDEVRAHNASGKVPVLLVDDTALTDSVAIMTYLADRHDALTFKAGSLDRAQQDGHTQFILDEMDAALWTASRHSFILPEEMRVPEIKDSLKWEYQRSLNFLADRLGKGTFLMGDTVTIPDLLATHCANWAISAKFPEPPAALANYFDRMRDRPAYQRVLAL